MEYIEIKGKTLDDAITNASLELGVTSDQLDYEVIEKGSSGFLGLNKKDAIIKARKKEAVTKSAPVVEAKKEAPKTVAASAPVVEKKVVEEKAASNVSSEELEKLVKDFLAQVFDAMKLEVEIITKYHADDKVIDVEFKGPEMGVLIGKRGQTLDSLQYLTNLVINKQSDNYVKVKLDTEDYRKRRKETLENLAKNIAYKVKRTKRPVSLEPMNPFERRVIHSALQNDKYVSTHSEGEEPYRHVVVTLKK